MKAALAAAGLPQRPYAAVQAAELEAEPETAAGGRLERQLGLIPCFVSRAPGSFRGIITRPQTGRSLLEGLRRGGPLRSPFGVEQGVTALELECAVARERARRAATWQAFSVVSVESASRPTGTTTRTQIHRWLERTLIRPLARWNFRRKLATTGDPGLAQRGGGARGLPGSDFFLR